MLKPYTTLDIIALTLALIHFGTPLLYYWYMKTKYLNKPWNIKINPNYKPRVTIIVPTYNEAKFIQSKLNNIYTQNYPKNLIEIIVVDSASTDGTAELAEEWASKYRNINMKLIRENERRGKAHALNHALKYATGDIVIIADADAIWPSNALKEALKWFADPMVGAVSCLKKPTGSNIKEVEENYRKYYNILRIAESKAWSTPIFHGELAAFKKKLIEELGGFPTDIGADDSHTATLIALKGYRAIVHDSITCIEAVARKGYFWWRIRRAQHLIQHFTKTLGEIKKAPKEFRKILAVEAFLHLFNPWTLLVSTLLFVLSIAMFRSLIASALLIVGIVLLTVKLYRTWIAQQIHLIVASIRNLWTKEIAWSKQTK